MIVKLKSESSGGKLTLIPENIVEVSFSKDLAQVFKMYKDQDLYDAIQKILGYE